MAESKETKPADAKETEELERQLDLEKPGSTDPGPHGEISRESPSGQPGDTSKNRTRADVPGAP